MNSDFKDAFRCLLDENVQFLVVGEYAVIHYTQPRFTKDLELPYLSRQDLVAAKRYLGRDQDRLDLSLLDDEIT